jgi:hypothetical protein
MAQLAPLLGQLRLAQTLMMFPLSKISVFVHTLNAGIAQYLLRGFRPPEERGDSRGGTLDSAS